MTSENTPSTHPINRTLALVAQLDAEKLGWALLLIIALLSRLVGLGDRAISHDESLHAVYSWQLFTGQGYQHDPMMHGPLKFVLNAISFFLFGDNDWSVRLVAALFGVLMIALVWPLRRWLGRAGAFAAAIMLVLSPALLYYSRYIRDEIILASLLIALVITMFRYLETHQPRWLVLTAGALAFSFLTMEASFIFGALLGIFLLLALIAQLWSSQWEVPSHRTAFRVAISAGLALLLPGVALFSFRAATPGTILTASGVVVSLLTSGWTVYRWRSRLHSFAELDLIVLLGTLALPFLSPIVMDLLKWPVEPFLQAGPMAFSMMWRGWLVMAVLGTASAALGWAWLRKRWLTSAGLFWAVELLFFTTFLTNGQGINTGIIGSLGYWIPQQEVARGGQPWYYFVLMVPLYEFLPLGASIGGTIAWLFRCRRESTHVPSVAPDSYGLPHAPQAIFNAFLVFWPLATWITFTYVGEKMPWHVVYFATAMGLLGGQWLGRIVDAVNWHAFLRKGGWWLAGSVPMGLLLLKALIPVASRSPFGADSGADISNLIQWILAVLFGAGIVYGVRVLSQALGVAQSVRIAGLSLAALLTVFTVGVSARLSFINYDYATEPLVYAHGTPDLKLAMSQIEEISRRTAGDYAIPVAYDADSTWPLEWYLRDYPNRVYYADTPNRESLDAPIVLAGHKSSIAKVRSILGDRYYEFTYRLVWWPRQTYWNLSWQRIRDGLRDPVQRGQFWDVVIHRRYTTPTAEWDPSNLFSLFIRKDIAGDIWGAGAPMDFQETSQEADPFASGWTTLRSEMQIGVAGTTGAAPGLFDHPRSIAVDANGRIYVADSGNNRIQLFNPDGSFSAQFGSTCKLDVREGCVGDGRGQFNEPWGIAVGGDGSIYVSDTWNHRVQKFDSNGNYLTMWGQFGSTGGALGEASIFYGPRGIVVGQDSSIYVVDTGNKRIQVFSPEGVFVQQFGGGGMAAGTFDEPVGLAQDPQGDWFVTDSWNRRVQRFDSALRFVSDWAIPSWTSTSVTHKPFLAVDGRQGLVYATDPEHYRVLAFALDGSYRFGWGQYGDDAASFMLPTGIAVGPDGRVFVVDTDASRVSVFMPIDQLAENQP